jgi:DNA-binding NarL/FixJ family response regulator
MTKTLTYIKAQEQTTKDPPPNGFLTALGMLCSIRTASQMRNPGFLAVIATPAQLEGLSMSSEPGPARSLTGRRVNGGVMARCSDRMVPEVVQVFWAAIARGEFVTAAAAEAGTYREKGTRWLIAENGIRPRRGRDLKGRCLTFAEREEIAVARAGGESMRSIARRLARSPSTISRELARNATRGCYRATTAHALAYHRASRPKPAKLQINGQLRRVVEEDLRHAGGSARHRARPAPGDPARPQPYRGDPRVPATGRSRCCPVSAAWGPGLQLLT